ncbi:MAG: hypothetical protein AB2L24_18890 [Mangrovibacterium sp.]
MKNIKRLKEEYWNLMKGWENNPLINTTWEKRNGVFVKFSLYSDSVSTSSATHSEGKDNCKGITYAELV